jgi:transposase
MIHYRKILELHDEGISLRGIAASTGNSRQKVTDIIGLAEKKGLVCPLEEEMTDKWIEEFLFPEKTLEASGRHPLNFDYIHEELAKPNITLSLLHHEYEAECRANKKIPYSYRSFLRHYSRYADKYKATLRIRRKPGEIMEVDWAGSTAFIIDRDTGEKVKAYCSLRHYRAANFHTRKLAYLWIHIRGLQFTIMLTSISVALLKLLFQTT